MAERESPSAFDSDGSVLDAVDIPILDGEFEPDSWVYVWLDEADPTRVVHVGATWLPPAVRTHLHLHDPDPSVGRIRADIPTCSTAVPWRARSGSLPSSTGGRFGPRWLGSSTEPRSAG